MTETRTNGDATAQADASANEQFDDSVNFDVDSSDAGTSELDQLRAERDDYLEQLRRSLADFANFRRRTEQDRAVLRQFANRDLLLQLIDVQDDFQRALGAIPDDQRATGWVSGTAMIERKLNTVLERSAVTQIDALGQPFDPAFHEAIGGSGTHVAQEFQRGYTLNGRTLRPSMVIVGDAPAEAEDLQA